MTRRRGPREIETVVEAMDDDGLGSGAFECRQVKARNALPGESVNVRILKRRRGVWYGEADTPPVWSPSRREAPCPNYPRCGGCALQHLDYNAQLAHKSQRLRHALERHGLTPRIHRPAVSGPRLHYRYKARLGVRVVGGELLAGFREGFSNRVARMDDCKTLALPFARLLPELKATLAALSRPDRVPQVELAGGDDDLAVLVRHLTALTDGDRALLRELARGSGIHVFVQPGGYDTVAPLDDDQPRYLRYANPDYGLSFEFLPTDFTQVNPVMNRRLVRNALLALDPEPGSRVLDLFCGIGNFSLALAREGAVVKGLEGSAGAVQRARHNAGRNGLSTRAEFAVLDLYDSRNPGIGETDYMLLDPPRSGAGPNLTRWVDSPGLQRIAYVSCNPWTFAGDAAVLDELGFELEEAGVYDMFPQTAHVETLGLFVRRARRHG